MKPHAVLDFLRGGKNDFHSGEDLSRKLHVTRSAIWKEIQNLRVLGYDIEAMPHLGYRLSGIPDKMFADEIGFGLATKLIGKPIFSYESLDSTNDAAFKLGERGFKEGACVFAESQKKGRGRLGRSWVSPKGKGMLLSILLRPVAAPTEVSKITLTTAVSIVKTVHQFTDKRIGIRWPNDILFEGKKFCGVLTEMSAELDRVNFVVVGVGINVNTSASELFTGATSLKEIAGKKISRQDFARAFLEEFEHDYLRLKNEGFGPLAKEWEDFSVTSGQRVIATLLNRKIHGQAIGIDDEGALWIRQDNGLQEKITAGDLKHLRS